MRSTLLPLLLVACLPGVARATAPDASVPSCYASLLKPTEGESNVDGNVALEFLVAGGCEGEAPDPALRDPNGAEVLLSIARSANPSGGTRLEAKPLAYLVPGDYTVDPKRPPKDGCEAGPGPELRHFHVGPGPSVRLVEFVPRQSYSADSPLEAVKIYLSEGLATGTETAIPEHVAISGLAPADIYYARDTFVIEWSWKRATGAPPTLSEPMTLGVTRGLTWASNGQMAKDFSVVVTPSDYVKFGWRPDGKPCPLGSSTQPPPSDPGPAFTCSMSRTGPFGLLAVILLLVPAIARRAARAAKRET